MDWIEKVLHVSPDGGNGSLELLLYLVVSIVAFLAVTGAARVRARRRRR
ncbi:MAG: hypothetical protein ACJ744_16545 [Gaiellaceae bacterium]